MRILRTAILALLPVSFAMAQTNTAITTTTLPNGTVNQPYSQQLMCSNCSGYLWSLQSGTLPAGLTLSQTGLISGTPALSQTSSFVVGITPQESTYLPEPITQQLSITIAAPTLAITQTNIPGGFQGKAYSTTITGSGGTPPYSWTFQSTANDGLTIGLSTGIISGTPTATGSFPLTVVLTDYTGTKVTQNYALNIATPLSILTTSLPNGTVGTVYPTQTLSAGGGQPAYRWTVTTGTLPPGLVLDGVYGNISGTPTTSGSYPFTLTVTDYQANTASANFTVAISGVSLAITPAALPSGTVGTAYSQTLIASGGTAPYTWSLASGTLPAGITLNPTSGVIGGTPTAAGTSSFTVAVLDSAKNTAQKALAILVIAPLVVTAGTLPDATVGVAYSQSPITVSGGVPPYSYALSQSSVLPAGFALNASTGAITGTAQTPETGTFSVTVTDSARNQGSVSLTLTAVAAAKLSVTPTSLPGATVGVAYTQALTASGGAAPYKFAVLTGSLPSGISLSTTGTISGTATAAGSSSFTVTVTDANGITLAVPLTLTVTAPSAPSITLSGLPVATGFQQQLVATPTLSGTYPSTITGTVSLAFTPSVTPVAGSTSAIDDYLIQFSGGGRTATFTMSPGSTTAPNITVLTGTTAGTITLTTVLTGPSGNQIGTSTQTIVTAAGAPFITKVQLTQTPGGVTVTVTGFSSTRDMTNAQFNFTPATNDTLVSDIVSVPVNTVFNTWWSNPTATNQYGTQFTLTVPFALTTTTATSTSAVSSVVIVSVTVTLENSKGASSPVTLSQ